jgi:hypothetical protein
MFGQIRVQAHRLPSRPRRCPISRCVYCVEEICDAPRINKGNGDATCYRWTNRRVLTMLEPVTD